ncbi:hypothetical protein [Nocardioides insulae]|uniref:divisome protein SepX/GlpR n=1 Tax=Nocardioides insulae TaxID=394734 RepID=UPI00040E1A1A|nr:hypothetical protein [Nocardioides insulae]
MDPSALIFVALAVAWAVYLIPKALEHHDESVRARTVDRFSKTVRVLARRDRSSKEEAELVTAESGSNARARRAPAQARPQATEAPAVSPAAAETTAPAPRRTASKVAARRRRNVLGVILLALATVATLAGFAVLDWAWTAVPGGLLIAWLVACRLMVKQERRARGGTRVTPPVPAAAASAPAADPVTEEVAVVEAPLPQPRRGEPTAEPVAAPVAEGMWTPVSAPLPTYVTAPAAHRSVRTIDLDSTGVWSSGRNDADSALAREAAEAARAKDGAQQRRASGS